MLKELTVCSIVDNLVHMVMCQAATLEVSEWSGSAFWVRGGGSARQPPESLSWIDLGKLDRS